MTFQQNLDKLWSTYICFLDTPNRLENAWHNQFGSWYQSSSCLENNLIEGSLEVKLPTIWRDEKQSREEAERRERLEERRVEEKE